MIRKIIIGIICVVSLVCCGRPERSIDVCIFESVAPGVEVMYFEDHEYIVLRRFGYGPAIIHSESCMCKDDVE